VGTVAVGNVVAEGGGKREEGRGRWRRREKARVLIASSTFASVSHNHDARGDSGTSTTAGKGTSTSREGGGIRRLQKRTHGVRSIMVKDRARDTLGNIINE